ncbi:MAG: FadR family transcriptional regulator [Lachnospiraceae bacterium]|nr:FadR family transcriptional regulator [Lachnospiraceae bacterium]
MDINYHISKEVLCDQVADRLEQMILSDKTQVGQKLPSEQALATGFGVSRPVIREALAILRARGLVTVQAGGGSSIIIPEPIQMLDVVNRLTRMHHISSEEVYEVRIQLEVMAARLAAVNAKPEQLKRMVDINRKMEREKRNAKVRAELDLQFHQQLAEASGNQLLSIFVQSMNGILQTMLESVFELLQSQEDGVSYHKRIIEALSSGDRDRSEAIIRDHLMMSMRNYELVRAQTQHDEKTEPEA